MAQVTSKVDSAILARQDELLSRMVEVQDTQAHHTQAILALGERVNNLEGGMPRHDYTPAQAQAPRGVSAPVSTLFGKELEVAHSARSSRTVSEGEAAVVQRVWADVRLREQYNRANKGKALLFVWGSLQADKSRAQAPSMYWDLRNAVDKDLIDGRKLTTEEVSVFGQILALCEEVDPETQVPFVSTYTGATQRVKQFLKRNK